MTTDDQRGSVAGGTAGNVTQVADELQISEFQLFETAYCVWHGRKTTDRVIEPAFVDYMFREKVPSWVRFFVRKAAGRVAEDVEIPAECRIERRPPEPNARIRGWGYLALLVGFLIFFCLMLVYGFPSY